MAISTTPNLLLPYPDGNEQVSAGPVDFSGVATLLDAGPTGPTATRLQSGTLAARPVASSVPLGTLYQCTDVACAFLRDTQPAWRYIPLDGTGTPIGSLQMYAGTGDPADLDGVTRWLTCDGRALSRTTYALLFAQVSTTYGTGNGTTTFNIPDLRGRSPLGSGSGTASDATAHNLGSSGGTETVTLSSAQIAAHTHTISSVATGVTANSATAAISDPIHNHSVNDPGHGHGVNDPGHGHLLQDHSPGSNAAYFGQRFVADGASVWDAATTSAGAVNDRTFTQSNTTGVGIQGAGTGISNNGSTTGVHDTGHTHGLSDPQHNHGGATGSVGSGTAHNNLQPYLAVGYIIKVQ